MLPPELLAAALESPADDTPRLVAADWLDEHAGTVACPRCTPKSYDHGLGWLLAGGSGSAYFHIPCTECGGNSSRNGGILTADGSNRGSGTVPDGRADRAELIRVQCELGRSDPTKPVRPSTVGILARAAIPFGGAVAAQQRMDRYAAELDVYAEQMGRRAAYRRRERELLMQTPAVHQWLGPALALTVAGEPVEEWFSRGFVSRVHARLADWQQHAPALLAAHPLERVEVADVPGLVWNVEPPSGLLRRWTITGILTLGLIEELRTAAFTTRPALVAGAAAAVAEITARLREAAGNQWRSR